MEHIPQSTNRSRSCCEKQPQRRESCVLVRRVIDMCKAQERCANATLTLPRGLGGGEACGTTNTEARVRVLSLDERCMRPGGLRATVEMTAPMTVTCGCTSVCGELTVVTDIVLRARCDTDWQFAGTLCATLTRGQCLTAGTQCVTIDYSATLYLTTLDTARVPVEGACCNNTCAPFFSLPLYPPDGRRA